MNNFNLIYPLKLKSKKESSFLIQATLILINNNTNEFHEKTYLQ